MYVYDNKGLYKYRDRGPPDGMTALTAPGAGSNVEHVPSKERRNPFLHMNKNKSHYGNRIYFRLRGFEGCGGLFGGSVQDLDPPRPLDSCAESAMVAVIFGDGRIGSPCSRIAATMQLSRASSQRRAVETAAGCIGAGGLGTPGVSEQTEQQILVSCDGAMVRLGRERLS